MVVTVTRAPQGIAVSVNGESLTILGVMPADFYYPTRTTEFWRPIAINPANASRGGHFLATIARLKDGVSFDQANTEILRHQITLTP